MESFAIDLSHELKNPLASIRSASELLADAESPDDRARFLDMIERDVARMEHLVSEVREVSVIDAAADDEERRIVQLDALLDELVEGVRVRAPEGIAIEWRRPSIPSVVRGVPGRLAQVFENLLDNALSFSSGGGRVEVSLDADERGFRVEVADSGPGIPEANLDRVFDRFFSYRPTSAGGSANGRESHTGLGLAIAKAIVESHAGAISAANREPHGAALTVWLPRA